MSRVWGEITRDVGDRRISIILIQGTELNVPLTELKKSAARTQTLGSKFHDLERNTIVEGAQRHQERSPDTAAQQSAWV